MQDTDQAIFASVPSLTSCFQNIIVRPLPPFFFLISFLWIIRRLIRGSTSTRQSSTPNGQTDILFYSGPFSWLTVAKLFLLVLLICTLIAEIAALALNAVFYKVLVIANLFATLFEILNFVCPLNYLKSKHAGEKLFRGPIIN